MKVHEALREQKDTRIVERTVSAVLLSVLPHRTLLLLLFRSASHTVSQARVLTLRGPVCPVESSAVTPLSQRDELLQRYPGTSCALAGIARTERSQHQSPLCTSAELVEVFLSTPTDSFPLKDKSCTLWNLKDSRYHQWAFIL
jgi:hypothetical protein